MGTYGKTFLTKPRLYSGDSKWVDESRFVFNSTRTPNIYSLSLLGIINGCPILSKHWWLACTVDDDTNEMLGWKIIPVSRLET